MKLNKVSRGRFEARIRELISDDALLVSMPEPMLTVREVMWEQYGKLHKLLVEIVRRDDLCRRYMRIPGVGPVTALSVKTALDDAHRFKCSKLVGTYLGLTPRRWQSGTSIDIKGRISKQGDGERAHRVAPSQSWGKFLRVPNYGGRQLPKPDLLRRPAHDGRAVPPTASRASKIRSTERSKRPTRT